ncbi:MAG: zinc ribbon domain-containing protein [Gammaproteobacteria bacterium]
MPTYVYQATGEDACRYCLTGFERRQKIADEALTACPECGGPVRRVITAPSLARSGADLSDSNVAKHGFTRYEKREKGVYEKTAGRGPRVIRDGD